MTQQLHRWFLFVQWTRNGLPIARDTGKKQWGGCWMLVSQIHFHPSKFCFLMLELGLCKLRFFCVSWLCDKFHEENAVEVEAGRQKGKGSTSSFAGCGFHVMPGTVVHPSSTNWFHSPFVWLFTENKKGGKMSDKCLLAPKRWRETSESRNFLKN